MKNYLVAKENKLVEASYKLTVGEQKLVLYYASRINPKSDKDIVDLEMKITDFAKLLDIEQSKDIYKRVKKASENLMRKIVTIHEEDGDLLISWFSSVKYYKGAGMVSLRSDPRLKPYLLNLKQYTQYRLENVLKLNSSYSIRIYEILKQYQKIRERTVPLDRLKELVGLKKDQYPRLYDFKKRVLLVAQKELEEKTDICFTFNEVKEGTKVVAIKFYIRKNSIQEENQEIKETDTCNNEVAITINENMNFALMGRLVDYGVMVEKAKSILQQYPEEQVIRNIEYAAKEGTKAKKENFAGFLIKSIEDDYSKDVPTQFNNNEGSNHDYDMDEIEKRVLERDMYNLNL